MTDWESDTLVVQVEHGGLIRPPIPLLVTTLIVASSSLALVFFNSLVGYLIAVGASALGGASALTDQKRRGNSNYVQLDWFRPTLRTVRFFVLAVAVVHVVILSIDAANGGSVFP